MFFFFKQKTAYELRISDWSSDVCSSDLTVEITDPATGAYKVTLLDNVLHAGGPNDEGTDATATIAYSITDADGSTVPGNSLTITFDGDAPTLAAKIGRESCRERGCQYV